MRGQADWMQMSRKHVIECAPAARVISIFGGKLSDCLNVGEEVLRLVKGDLKIAVPYYRESWFGEGSGAARKRFMHQARLMHLDAMTHPESSEKLSSRLWRRYGYHAMGILESIREDARMAELLIEGTEYIRGEVAQAAHREMVTKLDDFLRRRTKIALVVRRDDIRNAPGLMEACRLLFGDEAERKFEEYFSPT